VEEMDCPVCWSHGGLRAKVMCGMFFRAGVTGAPVFSVMGYG